MGKLEKEYCHYILSQCVDVEGKGEYLEAVDAVLLGIKKQANKKEKELSYDRLVVDAISQFFSSRILLLGLKREERMDKLYQYTKGMLVREQENVEKGRPVSLDSIFEIVNNMNIVMTNAMISAEENQEIVSYHTDVYNAEEVLERIDQVTGVSTKKEKSLKRVKADKRIGKAVEPNPKNALVGSSGTFLIWAICKVKEGIDVLIKANAEWNDWMLLYLKSVFLCTQIRKNELKERYGYGW